VRAADGTLFELEPARRATPGTQTSTNEANNERAKQPGGRRGYASAAASSPARNANANEESEPNPRWRAGRRAGRAAAWQHYVGQRSVQLARDLAAERARGLTKGLPQRWRTEASNPPQPTLTPIHLHAGRHPVVARGAGGHLFVLNRAARSAAVGAAQVCRK
jgi:hypothetical protein